MSLVDTYKLTNGIEIPIIGFGTWQSANGTEAYQSVRWALEAGAHKSIIRNVFYLGLN